MGRRIIRIVGLVWVTIAALLWLAGIAGAFAENGFRGGLAQVGYWLNPFNVSNLIVTAVVFGPGVALLVWADKLTRRAED